MHAGSPILLPGLCAIMSEAHNSAPDVSTQTHVPKNPFSNIEEEVPKRIPNGESKYTQIKHICCIGAGYVGGPTCAIIAKKVPDIKCTVVDINHKRIDAWNSNDLPIYEPDLEEIVFECRDGSRKGNSPNLFFSTDIEGSIAAADLIFVSVQTPTKLTGTGAGRALDLGFVEAATRKIAEASRSDKIVVEKSTVPCRTAETIRDVLSANGYPGVHFNVLSNPEFLAEGTAISDLLHPDRILIGSLADERGLQAAAALVDLYAQWVPKEKIITMNLWSSELAKIAANALLAQRISSINALSAICEATGAEVDEVSYAVGLDKRIGPSMLKSSIGFGGSCYKKDIFNLVYLAESLHLPEVAAYWKSVVDINEWQKDRFAKRVVSCLYNTLYNKRVAILGFAYKKNTGDTRESAAISVVNYLTAERAKISIYDPQVKEQQIWQDLHMSNNDPDTLDDHVTICKNAYDACQGASAVIIVTEWDEFKCDNTCVPQSMSSSPPSEVKENLNSSALYNVKNSASRVGTRSTLGTFDNVATNPIPTASKPLDWSRIAQLMKKPMFVFDGRNIVDGPKLQKLGFRVECIGNARFSKRQ